MPEIVDMAKKDLFKINNTFSIDVAIDMDHWRIV